MRLRKQALGDRNLIGSRVEAARKKQGMKQKELLAQLQVSGVDMNASGLSKLEGQIRFVRSEEHTSELQSHTQISPTYWEYRWIGYWAGQSRLNFLSFVGKASVNSPFKKMIAFKK